MGGRGDEISSEQHDRHVANRHGDAGEDQVGQKEAEKQVGCVKMQKEEAGADFSVGRPGVGFEKRERRPGGRREEDEGGGGPAEAGGDRACQLRVRHQGRRGGKLLTRAWCPVFHKKSLKCPPDSFKPVTFMKTVSGWVSGFTK